MPVCKICNHAVNTGFAACWDYCLCPYCFSKQTIIIPKSVTKVLTHPLKINVNPYEAYLDLYALKEAAKIDD